MSSDHRDAKTSANFYGLHPSSVESSIISVFEHVVYGRGLYVQEQDAETIRNFAFLIADRILERGGAGRVEPTGRRYSQRERDHNLKKAHHLSRALANRVVERAREGHAEPVTGEMYVGDVSVWFRTSAVLFKSICPPPLPPFC